MGSETGRVQEERGRRVAGYEVVGPSARGHLVRGPEGEALEARICSVDDAAVALRNGAALLPEHGHRETLVDLCVDDGVVVLLTRPAVVETLARVLERGHRLPAGAAVTVLAPIAGALRDAADHGVVLSIGTGSVGLTAEGRPVLLLGEEGAGSTPASAFRAVLLAAAPESSPPEDADLAGLEAHLYRWAAPAPLGELLTAPAVPAASEGPEPGPTGSPSARARIAGITATWRLRFRRRSAAAGASALARHRRVHPLDGWRGRAVAMASARRGPLLAAAAVVLGALVAGLVSGNEQDVSAPPEGGASADPTGSHQEVAPRPPSADLPAAEAATALLRSFASCSGATDRSCIDSLSAEDSPLRSDGGPDFVAALGAVDHAALTDEQGASALLSIDATAEAGETTAASVLIIRTEAGWLLREVFTEEGG
jgi:hypothetical protein